MGVPRDSYVLASKVGRVLVPTEQDQQVGAFDDPAPYQPVFRLQLRRRHALLEDSLKRLGVDRIDILHIHDPDNHWQEPSTVLTPRSTSCAARASSKPSVRA